MGFDPRTVDSMSLWEFAAVAGGFAKANNPDHPDRLTREDADELAAMIH